MNILQLTDIHIGGEYDGKFKCKLNFLATLHSALKDSLHPVDLIVITGDLADNNYLLNYMFVRKSLERTGKPYIVIPGNHDDPAIMRDVFDHNTLPECGYMVRDGILYWDNAGNDAMPPETDDYHTVFCHYPVGYVPHKFMESYAHPNSVKWVDILNDKKVFCGHFHFSYTAEHCVVTAATQCQLDPESSECKPMSPYGRGLPGYSMVFVTAEGRTIDSMFRYVIPSSAMLLLAGSDYDMAVSYLSKLVNGGIRELVDVYLYADEGLPLQLEELSELRDACAKVLDLCKKLQDGIRSHNYGPPICDEHT